MSRVHATAGRSRAAPRAEPVVRVPRPVVQPKLRIGAPDDRFEHEADRVADQVMRMPEPAVQRTCAECEEEQLQRQPLEEEEEVLQTKPRIQRSCTACEDEAVQAKEAPGSVPDLDSAAAGEIRGLSGGRPLPPAERAFFEPRMGADFGDVRVHTGPRAEALASEVQARAFTHGRDVVFGRGEYGPGSSSGRRLMAHELAHVVQQRQVAGPAAGELVSRADRQAVDRTLALGNTLGSGIRFWPTNVVDTVVGPVTVRGGLLSSRASRLNVIVGENVTPRVLARMLLPLWTTATPFTPPGATAPNPLDVIDEEILARGLLVYNQYYLPVPAMTRWRAGLRVPLPVEIDAGGIATLHPTLIRNLAGAFDAAWTPLLESSTAATVAPPAATLAADVTAFLAAEPTADGRGIAMGARAETNAVAELPFIREVFRQLGAAGFEVALAFMDHLVNREIELLAAQRDGAAILAEVRTALGLAPATPTAAQQASLDRANLMLGRVAATPAIDPPAGRRNRAEKTVTVDMLKLDGSNHTPSTDIAIANAIYSHCNIRVVPGVNRTATAAETTAWLGADRNLSATSTCGSTSLEERRVWRGGETNYGMGASIRAFFVQDTRASGYSFPAYCATGAAFRYRGFAAIDNSGSTDTLAHEIGHILINHKGHPAGTLMAGRPRPTVRLTDWQCDRAYRNA